MAAFAQRIVSIPPGLVFRPTISRMPRPPLALASGSFSAMPGATVLAFRRIPAIRAASLGALAQPIPALRAYFQALELINDAPHGSLLVPS